mmetsp:Transcript_77578/g.251162  ORF Transcript_77578/g.251162 Transcript_77578/m.251162 type:complete len:168 (+) Transcript_77578:420-923(+)
MGGLEQYLLGEEAACKPDATVNNLFDLEAAEFVYRFCFASGVRMTVTNRKAVPEIPLNLAASVAEGSHCALMQYLSRAQFFGLVGLWHRLCENDLPARCTKQWFFETFCGVDADRFIAGKFDRLDRSDDIQAHLNGTVRPYDVIACMTVLPQTKNIFPANHEARAHH